MTVILREAQADVREKIWKVLRAVNQFTIEEVATLTETSYHSVSSYVFMLYQSGYARQAGKKADESGKKRVVWRLVRNTGPKAPVPCKCLYDPNIDEVKLASQLTSEPAASEKKKTDKPASWQAGKPGDKGAHHVD